MKGHVDERRRCWAEITIVGTRDQITLEAMLDTGFTGWICLPIQIAIHLGLELQGLQTIELADGARKRELVFRGQATFAGEQEQVDIILSEAENALLGTGMLTDCILTIDFVDQTLDIVRKGK
ncbi:MAG: hypothetical protein U9R11_01035 [Chloroflexota bacterium]|nr:hypothetical protein [Chloroflexota bacterium]